MTVHLWSRKLSYVSVPKVACTSVKHMFYEVENGREFQPFRAQEQPRHIHNTVYPGVPFNRLPHERIADHRRLALVRDPVRRFLSAYSNRVLHHRELSEAKAGAALRELDLAPDPGLPEFVARLEDYREAAPQILHHTRPMTFSLGRDPGYYAALYDIGRIDDFVADVEAWLGVKVTMRRLQTGGPKIGPEALSAAETRRVREFYTRDYDCFGAHFAA